MNYKNILNITDEDGKIKEIDIILYFTLETNNKDYIIYSEFENGNKILYASEVVKINDEIELRKIKETHIIEELKNIISEVENG